MMAAPNGKYDPATFPDIARALARKGHIEKEIAKVLGVSTSTLTVYKREHPEFLKALKEGKAPADAAVEAALYKRANGYDIDVEEITTYPDGTRQVKQTKKHIPGDITAQIFWLKNRLPNEWRDRREVTGEDGNSLAVIRDLTDEEVLKRAREIVK